MSKDSKGKPTYQAPVVMPLGELAKGEGATCQTGGSASNRCRPGGTARLSCANGSVAAGGCGSGTTPTCNFGFFG